MIRSRTTAGGAAFLLLAPAWLAVACSSAHERPASTPGPPAVRPLLATEPVPGDADDPALWLHPTDPARSLILGTDKGGGLYVFDLDGRIDAERSVTGLARPNNVDVEQDVMLDGRRVDLAVVSERDAGRVRVFSLPDMTPLDGGGIEVFVGESGDRKAVMGVGLYKRPADGALFAVLSRKSGLTEGYLWQYRVDGDGRGDVRLTKVRELGAFSGGGSEIEAIFVDDALGYIYCSDEWAGIRKYAADPDAPNADRELAFFGTEGFSEDREGISLYALDEETGYLLVSDQQANRFRVFPREGTANGPHDHPEIAVITVSTLDSDGSETTSRPLGPKFPHGAFVAMSEDRTFQIYRWQDLAGGTLESRAP